jgi:hypothetical protein
MSFLAEIVAEFLFKVLIWVILWPVVIVLATPVILVRALCIQGTFSDNVKEGYEVVYAFLMRLGEKL